MGKVLSALILFFCLGVTAAKSADLESPHGPIILTVTGQIQNKNSEDVALFDKAMLEKITSGKIVTETRWHDGVNTFEGPTGKAFLEAIGVLDPALSLKVTALNDYAISIPARDFFEKGLILAMKLNGKHMSVREKGPLFVMYPFSDNPALQKEQYYSRSIWQIKSIHVE